MYSISLNDEVVHRLVDSDAGIQPWMICFSVPFSTSLVIDQLVVTSPLAASYCQDILVSRGMAYAYLWNSRDVLGGRQWADRGLPSPENVTAIVPPSLLNLVPSGENAILAIFVLNADTIAHHRQRGGLARDVEKISHPVPLGNVSTGSMP